MHAPVNDSGVCNLGGILSVRAWIVCRRPRCPWHKVGFPAVGEATLDRRSEAKPPGWAPKVLTADRLAIHACLRIPGIEPGLGL